MACAFKPTKLAAASAFPNPTVLREEHLMWADVVSNHNKFYRLFLEQSSDGQYRLRTHYGRVGADGIQEVRAQGRDRWSADAAFADLSDEKTRKGYRKVDVIASAVPTTAATTKTVKGHTIAVAAVASTGKGKTAVASTGMLRGADAYQSGLRAPTSWDTGAQSLYNELLRLAHCLVDTGAQVSKITAAGVVTPLGVLSDLHLGRAQQVLESLAAAITRRANADVMRLNSDFYSLIPTPVGRRLADAAMTTLAEVQEKQHVVRAMRDLLAMEVANATAAQTTKGRKKKKAVEAPAHPVLLSPASTAERAEILRMIREERCSCHDNQRLTIREAFKVERPADAARFRKDLGNLQLLFHGTRQSTAAGVLSRGLLPSREAVQSGGHYSGNAFGGGIYFAKNASKSLGYCDGRVGERVLFVTLVALGKPVVLENGTQFRGYPPDTHSIHGAKGSRLVHDEYIVPNSEQTALTYLIRV